MTRGWQIFLALALVGVFALLYEGLWGDPRMIPTVLIGTNAPDIEGPDVESGRTISLHQFKGKVVLLNFWASWCQECRLEHQNLLRLHEQFKDASNFVMLGVNYQDDLDDAQGYLKQFGSAFPHIRDLKGALAIDFGVYGVPETFLIDQHGVIRHKWVGSIVGDVYTQWTNAVIPPLLHPTVASHS